MIAHGGVVAHDNILASPEHGQTDTYGGVLRVLSRMACDATVTRYPDEPATGVA